MKNLEIFENFMNLGYTEGIRRTRMTDTTLGGLVILRSDYHGSTVHYLQDGSSLFIPWLWIDLFTSLYIHSGEQILFNDEIDAWAEGYKETFIYLFVKLVKNMTEGQVNGEEFLDILSDICIIKTSEFRTMLKEKYNLVIEPFEYRSLHKTFEI